MSEKNKRQLGLAVFCLVLMLFSNGIKVNAANQNDNSLSEEQIQNTLITEDIEKQIEDYGKQKQDTSVFKEGVNEVLPFYSEPFSNYNIELDSKAKQAYKSGDELKIMGSLGYSFQGAKEASSFYEDCKKKVSDSKLCLNSEIYSPIIQNAEIFVQIWRRDSNTKTKLNGDFLVDEFFAKQAMNLNSTVPQNFELSWKIPSEIRKGDYYADLYVLSANSFELSGNPTASFSNVKSFNFSIDSDSAGIELGKDNIKINGKEYLYRSPAPVVEANDKGEISFEIPLINYNKSEEKATVKYDLYKWSQTDPDDRISSNTEQKNIQANEKTNLQFSIKPDDLDSVYNLKIFVLNGKSKSTANVRFIVDQKNRGIFRFIGVSEKNNIDYPFFCLRNAQWDGIFEGKVKLTFFDSNGNQKEDWEKDAKLNALTRCFVIPNIQIPENECYKIKGEIFNKDNQLVYEKEVNGGCKIVEKNDKNADSVMFMGKNIDYKNQQYYILIFAAILFIIAGIILYLNNKKNK